MLIYVWSGFIDLLSAGETWLDELCLGEAILFKKSLILILGALATTSGSGCCYNCDLELKAEKKPNSFVLADTPPPRFASTFL